MLKKSDVPATYFQMVLSKKDICGERDKAHVAECKQLLN